MASARQLKQLRAMSDEDLIWEHDVAAANTVVGTDYFIRELERREAVRAAEASDRLARASIRLSWASFIASVVAVAISVVALLVTN